MMSHSDPAIRQLRAVAQRYWDAYDPSTSEAADPYLVAAARRLQEGDRVSSVADYIVETEIDCLGIDTGQGIWERAYQFAFALKGSLGRRVC
jgi:hypothetical protein